MRLKITSKTQKSLIIASLIFLILVISEVTLFTSFKRKSSENIQFTQITANIPTNRENKTFILITPARRWIEEGDMHTAIFNCSIYNNTKHDFADWEITLKVPENTTISTNWNCSTEIKDNYLHLTADYSDSSNVPSSGVYSFGFILSSEEEIKFKSINYNGYLLYRLRESLLNNIICSCIFAEIVTILISLIVHNIMQKRIVLLHEQKERDNLIIEQTMKTFVNFIDAKDDYTRGHSTRVAEYSREIAKEMGLDSDFVQDIYYMGLMHDIGKITIPDSILNKTSHLSTDEWEIIKMHTANGAKLLKDFNILPEIGNAALYHHERYDGKGYLSQIKGTDIPLSARIICVADSFDAMNTNRCYRLKYSKDRIIQEFERCSGKQFDPDASKALINLLKDNRLNN